MLFSDKRDCKQPSGKKRQANGEDWAICIHLHTSDCSCPNQTFEIRSVGHPSRVSTVSLGDHLLWKTPIAYEQTFQKGINWMKSRVARDIREGYPLIYFSDWRWHISCSTAVESLHCSICLDNVLQLFIFALWDCLPFRHVAPGLQVLRGMVAERSNNIVTSH